MEWTEILTRIDIIRHNIQSSGLDHELEYDDEEMLFNLRNKIAKIITDKMENNE